MSAKLTTEQFIEKANTLHDNFYGYSLAEYSGKKTKLIIICPIHGNFEQSPDVHYKSGCPTCGQIKRANGRSLKEIFPIQANKVHNNKYDYSLSEYQTSNDKVKILCSAHGVFLQTPNHHILREHGCPKCKGERFGKSQSKSEDTFLAQAKKVHKNLYNYDKTTYEKGCIKIIITCKEHGDFLQTPGSHLQGNGCPTCAKILTGWSQDKFTAACTRNTGTAILYVIRCFNENEEFYKIGITSRTVKKRYGSQYHMPYDYEIVQEITGVPTFIWVLEKNLHKLYKDYKYIPKISFGGHLSECFKL